METQLLRQRTSPIDRLSNILEKLPQYEDRSAKGDVPLLSLGAFADSYVISPLPHHRNGSGNPIYMPRHQYCSQPHFNFSVPLPTCRNG